MLKMIMNFKKNSFLRPISKKKKHALASLRVGKMKRKRKVEVKPKSTIKLGSVQVPLVPNMGLLIRPYKIKR